MKKDSHQWWDKKWGKNSVCVITHTRLRPGVDKDGLSYVISLSCGHFFLQTSYKCMVYKEFRSIMSLFVEK